MIGRLVDGRSLQPPHNTLIPTPRPTHATRRADLAAERARAEAAGARLRRLQGYRLEDDGRAALHLLVLEESEDGVEEAGAPPFRVAHATNAAYDAAFAWRGEGVAEAECARRVMNPLLFAV